MFFAVECVALSVCPDNPRKRYDNCFGTKQNVSGTSKYVGTFKNNNFHGQGVLKRPDGRQYVGEFKDGIQHGQGTEIWSNGNKYFGQYKEGKRHGFGIEMLFLVSF